MRVRFESLGCRLNISEIESLVEQLTTAGHRVAASEGEVDLCILNSCTVTGEAARKSRQAIRSLRRAHPNAAIVVTGCFAELAPEQTQSLGADLVVGNRDKERLLEIMESSGLLCKREWSADETTASLAERDHTRAFVKAQDGCDNCCSFCIVTKARGPCRSTPADRVVAEVQRLCRNGYKEAVLTGVHLGSYGHDQGDRNGLRRLVERVLDETMLPRLRLSSLEPWDIEPGFFELFTNPRLLPHLHLPLQSGCDATLRRMARRTSRSEYSELIAAARRAIPELAISTDIMVGFPGETDDEFAESVAFVEEMAFSRLHIFRYSRRQGTPAAELPGMAPGPVAKERSRRMRRLGETLATAFHQKLIGRRLEVLWETSETLATGRRWSGLTPGYVRAFAETGGGVELFNQITVAEITGVTPEGVKVQVVSPAT
jgi:threonylcarbamoyladenosine tRNA methylthiotransferase MtaB